jgi:hypothetical protein
VTTMERIRGYSPARLFSERGDWYLRLEPSEDDPAPMRVEREVPKPFNATDPGAEPIKSELGCQAGTLVGTDHVNELVDLMFRKDMREDDELVEVTREWTGDGTDYDSVRVKRTWTSWVYYGEFGQSWQDSEWQKGDKTDTTYEQCPHCKAFDVEHERWRMRMHGARWGTRFDGQTGYATYRKMMDMFGNMEAWREAYLADYRARMAYIKAEREWDQRNRIPFYDGVIIDSDGYAKRERKGGPSKAKLNKHERAVKKVKEQIDTYVNGFIAELQTGNMPMPSGGDCWYCAMFGDKGGEDHLWNHMEENYYVPSLAVNALREKGYQDAGVFMWLDMNLDGTGKMGRPGGRYDNVKRDITSYLRKRLVPQAPTS